MSASSNQWHLDARVPALLDAIRAEGSEIKTWLEPSISCLYGRDVARAFVCANAKALEDIFEEYGERALRAGDASGDYTAFHTHCSCPSVEQLVSHVLGEMQKFTSQEALVVDAMAAINARRSDAMRRAA